MIDLYFAPTPNGQKISIMLEECELPYSLKVVNLAAGDQFEPEFLAISPNNRIPAIVDHDGPNGKPLSLMESSAILVYLADKTGKFLAKEGAERYEVLQWLEWQQGGFGPMLGQASHFNVYYKERLAYPIERFIREAKRLYGVLDKQLEGKDYICGEYSIADMATWPWVVPRKHHEIDLANFTNVARWNEVMKQRPHLRKGFALLRDAMKNIQMDAAQRKQLYGSEDAGPEANEG